ncbi:uncharacterized protein BCR38DRAFT_3433 [Pseudomassariella vexata]|uniref:2EXR domain-containing protein n=1 Tax=Pseudomassariella vexata TaxID=1141098 RepID=A0A1Y2EHP2_9PEZI|nr:uncharacterized protein BCR38DRAFT_3433 [Pseudomassariella vexata]ORY71089.1 hypothetical protein BCR38DRAFT_3433 [Pseudomassariella vexata]
MEHTLSTLFSSLASRPQTFDRFRQLPPELRIKIWQHAMPPARTIVVKPPRQQETPTSIDEALVQSQDDTEQTWRSNAQIPALLHVNAEARHEALKHYKLSLAVGKAQPQIYVDFIRDTLFFGTSELNPQCSDLWASTHDLDKVQRLAVIPEGAYRVLRWKKVDLNALQKMIFVSETEGMHLGSNPELVEDTPQEEVKEIVEHIEAEAQKKTLDKDVDMPIKKRMKAAREELDTLMMVLPSHWEKEPVVVTAVFRKQYSSGLARWVC